MPAIVDHEAPGGPLSIFESGAILMYLAEKTGRFWPVQVHERYKVAEWVMWQMGGLGPMLGQAGHFTNYAPGKIPYAIERYTNEAKRLLGVLNRQLAGNDFIAGEYSIADMACYGWALAAERLGVPAEDIPNVIRWRDAMGARPAVERGMELLAEKRRAPGPMDEKTREIMFGKKQFEKR
jgi:GST-like protein